MDRNHDDVAVHEVRALGSANPARDPSESLHRGSEGGGGGGG